MNVGFSNTAEFGILANAILEALEFSGGVSVSGTISHTLNMNCDWEDRVVVRRPRATIKYETRVYRVEWEYQTEIWGRDPFGRYPTIRRIGFRWHDWYTTGGTQVRNFTVRWDDYIVSDTGTCCEK